MICIAYGRPWWVPALDHLACNEITARALISGAINSLRTNLTIIDSHFDSNHATHTDRINQFADCGGGGGLYIDGARGPESGGPLPTVIQGSSFTNNTTNNHGGGLFAGL